MQEMSDVDVSKKFEILVCIFSNSKDTQSTHAISNIDGTKDEER